MAAVMKHSLHPLILDGKLTSALMILRTTEGVGAVPLTIEVGTAGVEVNSSPLSLPSSETKGHFRSSD